jgi:hypothetical protein
MKVLGIDQSLTGTGVYGLFCATMPEEGLLVVPKERRVYYERGKKKPRSRLRELKGSERLVFIRNRIETILEDEKATGEDVDLVVMEGYAYGARFSKQHALGELGGVIKTAIWERGLDMLIVPPTVVKSANLRTTTSAMRFVWQRLARRI